MPRQAAGGSRRGPSNSTPFQPHGGSGQVGHAPPLVALASGSLNSEKSDELRASSRGANHFATLETTLARASGDARVLANFAIDSPAPVHAMASARSDAAVRPEMPQSVTTATDFWSLFMITSRELRDRRPCAKRDCVPGRRCFAVGLETTEMPGAGTRSDSAILSVPYTRYNVNIHVAVLRFRPVSRLNEAAQRGELPSRSE